MSHRYFRGSSIEEPEHRLFARLQRSSLEQWEQTYAVVGSIVWQWGFDELADRRQNIGEPNDIVQLALAWKTLRVGYDEGHSDPAIIDVGFQATEVAV